MYAIMSPVLTIERVARHVLLLCQDSPLATQVRIILQQEDYQVTTVSSPGDAASCILDDEGFDVVICDGRLSQAQQEGRVLHRLRLNLEALGIPFLMLLDLEDHAQWALADRMAPEEFVLKPIQKDEFSLRLRGLLWRRENRAKLRLLPCWPDLLGSFVRYIKDDLENKSAMEDSAGLVLLEPAGAWHLAGEDDNSCDHLTEQLMNYFTSNLRRADRVIRCGRVTLLIYMPERTRELTNKALQLHQAELTERTNLSFYAGVSVYPDDGTSFLDLLLSADEELRRERARQLETASQRSSMVRHYPPDRIILILDDDPFSVQPLRAAFDAMGYHTVVGDDGADALQLIQQEQPDLLILDQLSHGPAGFDLLELLQAHSGGRTSVPVIMVTSLTADNDIIRGIELGVEDYVRKPFTSSELITRVERVLAEHPSFLRAGV